jgi:hypothetical protein
MMQRVLELLKGNFWVIDLNRLNLSDIELKFLSNFFNIEFDKFIDEFNFQEREFLILKKKTKFLSIH